jgi:glucokinase
MIIAVDTGGTKTLIARFSEKGGITERVRFPTPQDQNEYLALLKEELHLLIKKTQPKAISVSMPGLVKKGVVVWCGNLPWKNFAIVHELQKEFPGIPVFVENDANLGGLAETRALPLVPESCIYVAIRTGIGTAIIEDGQIARATRHSEGGHMLVEYDGVVQPWERFASGKAIYETYGKYARDITSERTWHQITDRISRGFLALIPVIQPEVIIIGGSMGTHFGKFGTHLSRLLAERLPKYIPCPRVIAARHPEEAVLYGCYLHALDSLG